MTTGIVLRWITATGFYIAGAAASPKKPTCLVLILEDVIRADFLVAVTAVFLISDACLALLIKLVKVDVIVNGGLIQADRNQYKPHRDGHIQDQAAGMTKYFHCSYPYYGV